MSPPAPRAHALHGGLLKCSSDSVMQCSRSLVSVPVSSNCFLLSVSLFQYLCLSCPPPIGHEQGRTLAQWFLDHEENRPPCGSSFEHPRRESWDKLHPNDTMEPLDPPTMLWVAKSTSTTFPYWMSQCELGHLSLPVETPEPILYSPL